MKTVSFDRFVGKVLKKEAIGGGVRLAGAGTGGAFPVWKAIGLIQTNGPYPLTIN